MQWCHFIDTFYDQLPILVETRKTKHKDVSSDFDANDGKAYHAVKFLAGKKCCLLSAL